MQYVLCTPAEVLAKKIAIWESRLAYAKTADPKRVAECERALSDLRARLAASV